MGKRDTPLTLLAHNRDMAELMLTQAKSKILTWESRKKMYQKEYDALIVAIKTLAN